MSKITESVNLPHYKAKIAVVFIDEYVSDRKIEFNVFPLFVKRTYT